MEYVKGKQLLDLIPHDGLTTEMVVRYGIQIVAALDHAHSQGIIHRDLKSANIMVTPDGRAKVLDFGLARRIGGQLDGASLTITMSTHEEGPSGTLYYIAPEVLRGHPADPRADIWALGVTLHEMAGGRLPFRGKTGFELTAAILHESPEPLPLRVPPGLQSVIKNCLEKDPAKRYQTAGEVRAALEALAAPRQGVRLSTGGTPSTARDANEYFERAMLFLTAQYDLFRCRKMLESALKIDPKFAEARAWYGFTHLLLLDTGYSNDRNCLNKAEAELRHAIQDDPNAALAHAALAAAYLYRGRKELVPAQIEKALKINPEDLVSKSWLMNYHQYAGEYAAVKRIGEDILAHNALFYPATMILGYNYFLQGDVERAIAEEEKVLEQDPTNFYALLALARIYLEKGDVTRATETMESVKPADQKTYRYRANLALLLALRGDKEEAHKLWDTDVEKFAAAHLVTTLFAAEFYAVQGQVDKALEWLDLAGSNGDERVEWFRRDALLANIRNDPRFGQIVESILARRQERTQHSPES
jgi:Tfp pilus assembly protein PilF